MTPEIAKAALMFLERTTLRPAERQAFDTVVQALLAIVNKPAKPRKAAP